MHQEGVWQGRAEMTSNQMMKKNLPAPPGVVGGARASRPLTPLVHSQVRKLAATCDCPQGRTGVVCEAQSGRGARAPARTATHNRGMRRRLAPLLGEVDFHPIAYILSASDRDARSCTLARCESKEVLCTPQARRPAGSFLASWRIPGQQAGTACGHGKPHRSRRNFENPPTVRAKALLRQPKHWIIQA